VIVTASTGAVTGRAEQAPFRAARAWRQLLLRRPPLPLAFCASVRLHWRRPGGTRDGRREGGHDGVRGRQLGTRRRRRQRRVRQGEGRPNPKLRSVAGGGKKRRPDKPRRAGIVLGPGLVGATAQAGNDFAGVVASANYLHARRAKKTAAAGGALARFPHPFVPLAVGKAFFARRA